MKSLLSSLLLVLSFASVAGEYQLGEMYARWTDTALVVGNSKFERLYSAEQKLVTATFHTKKGPELVVTRGCGTEWSTLAVECAERASSVGETALVVNVTCGGEKTELLIYPSASGPLVSRSTIVSEPEAPAPTEYLALYAWRKARAEALRSGTDLMLPRSTSPKITISNFRDRTDGANELVSSEEILLHPCEEPRFVSANVLDVRDVETDSGVVFLRLAPLPSSRPVNTCDFVISGTPRAVAPVANGYSVAELAYDGGDIGRTRAIILFQRAVRSYRTGRDGLFLSNTWGDGNRDSRINEEFLMKEVASGAELGVDVIQIDDGWQKGRTANSAAVESGSGTWSKYWDVDAEFWRPCPERFPNGLDPVVAAAAKKGMKFGLWFGPDSSHECKYWEKDAECLLDFHRRLGIDYFKMDSMVILSGEAAKRQRKMFDLMLTDSKGAMTFDLDCTANVRPGYFGLMDVGPLFVENRYIRPGDGRLYYPHQTLRNLWKLAQAIDPIRLRMEVLNPLRNPRVYHREDSFAPSKWKGDALFAITMCSSPLGWFEISNLDKTTVAEMKPLVAIWKRERANLHGGITHSVGAAPDGVAWTGFVTEGADGSRYVLLFREMNASDSHSLDLSAFGTRSVVTVLAGEGSATLDGTLLKVSGVPKFGYLWMKLAD